MTVLRADSVQVKLEQTQVLNGVSFSATTGEVHALLGPNGAGKSTLLAVLAGDIAPSSGRVSIDDRPMHTLSLDERSRLRAVLTQQQEVAFGFSSREVVELGRRPWHATSTSVKDADAIDWAMRATDVTQHAIQRVNTLSGGERARVALARVLAQDTDILLLDEPTAALDVRHQEDVMRLARSLAHDPNRPRAVVVVLHDMNLAAAYADVVWLLSRGELAGSGAPSEVLTAEQIELVYGQRVEVFCSPSTGQPLIVPLREG